MTGELPAVARQTRSLDEGHTTSSMYESVRYHLEKVAPLTPGGVASAGSRTVTRRTAVTSRPRRSYPAARGTSQQSAAPRLVDRSRDDPKADRRTCGHELDIDKAPLSFTMFDIDRPATPSRGARRPGVERTTSVDSMSPRYVQRAGVPAFTSGLTNKDRQQRAQLPGGLGVSPTAVPDSLAAASWPPLLQDNKHARTHAGKLVSKDDRDRRRAGNQSS
jgi:hypothetical protein